MLAMRPRYLVLPVLGVLLIAWMAWTANAPGSWDKATLASVGQGFATFVAIGAALLIGYQDRRHIVERARHDRAEERAAFLRRRDYDECIRLLQLIEVDRQQWERANDPMARPRSAEATALVRALWARRNWWGTVVEWYVESRNPGWRFSSDRPAPQDVFAQMQKEIVEAIMKLDFLDRGPEPDGHSTTGLRTWMASRLTTAAAWLSRNDPKAKR